MTALKEATEEFLAQKRVAIAGVSRSSGEAANLVYRRLRDRGYTVMACPDSAVDWKLGASVVRSCTRRRRP